jgi:hypothetical protein
MVGVAVESGGSELCVHLSAFEAVGALQADFYVPMTNIEDVRVSQKGWKEVDGWLHSMLVPGFIALGTVRHKHRVKDFCAVYKSAPAVVVKMVEGESWGKLILCTSDPEKDVATIRAALSGIRAALCE